MNKYARIGRACLIQAIGPQQNHVITELRESNIIDRCKTVCYTCSNYHDFHMESYSSMPKPVQENMDAICQACPHCSCKKEIVTKYVNEKHQYGYGVRLSLVATKLLIYFHFQNPDNNGCVKYISITDAAKTVGCSRRSIFNAIKKLSEHDYIMAGNCGNGLVNVIIKSYKNIALPANKGGRGYITINREMLSQLMECKGITQLRVTLRILLDVDTSKDGTTTEELTKFKRFLPSYCKAGVIKKALLLTKFAVSFFDNGKILINLNKEICGKICWNEERSFALSTLKQHMYAIKKDMESANQKLVKHKNISAEKKRLKKLGYTLDANREGLKFFVGFKVSEQDLDDLAGIAASYSIDAVKNALLQVYKNYNISFINYKIGPLVRTMIKYGNCSSVIAMS